MEKLELFSVESGIFHPLGKFKSWRLTYVFKRSCAPSVARNFVSSAATVVHPNIPRWRACDVKLGPAHAAVPEMKFVNLTD